MNKVAKCIEMLNILKNRGTYMPKSELASRLEINPRNIKEYRKELEAAGYDIEYKAGKYGGYRLNQSSMVPSVRLSDNEQKALRLGARFIEEHKEVVHREDFVKAIEKINGALNKQESIEYAYRNGRVPKYTKRSVEMIKTLEIAIKEQCEVIFEYESNQANEFKTIHIFPYEIVCSNGFYYVVGYALHHKEFRTYKISEQRMRNILIQNRTFERDKDFNINEYTGKKSISKSAMQEVQLAIEGSMAKYVAENEVGINSDMYFKEGVLYLTTTFENEYACDSFILSLGENARVLGSEEVKQRIISKIMKMKEKY